MKKFICILGLVIISSFLFYYKGNCQNYDKTDNASESCNTEAFTSLTVTSIVDVKTLQSAEFPVGVMVRTKSKEKIRGIKVYVKNNAPFYIDIYSGKQSESGFMNRKKQMKHFLPQPLLCHPSGKGYFTVDLSSYSITAQDDLYFMFTPCKEKGGEAQQLAVYKSHPMSRFLALSTTEALTYVINPTIDKMPIFIALQ